MSSVMGQSSFSVCRCQGLEPYSKRVKPLSPDSEQDQFSPNNIHMLPREMVMRVDKMITQEKML